MIELVRKHLSSSLPPELVNDLLNSYVKIKDNFRKEDYREVIGKSGRFAENVFRILYFLDKGSIIKEVKEMHIIEKSIAQNNDLNESIRILIPRITRSIIYSIRSKKDSIHIKEKIPDFIDANLNMTAANWVLAELLRETSKEKELDILKIIKELMKKNYALMQIFEGQKVITKNLGAEKEILLILFQDVQEGMTRKEIGNALVNYAAPTITNSLKKLAKERKIHKSKSNRYYITDNGEKVVSDVITES